MQTSKKRAIIPFILPLGFFLSQIQSLTRFPFMHSDESWLSGLTRLMMESKSLAVTEPFFDLYPRNPHAIKSTYHILQSFFIRIFGYELFSVRLMSLLFGCISLFLFYRLIQKILGETLWPLLGTLLLAAQPVFVYGSHFARQEIVVLCFLLLIANAWINGQKKRALIVAFIAMGLHPNAFLGGFALVSGGLCLLWQVPNRKKDLLRALPWLAGFTFCYILASLWMNPDFFKDYLAYGATLGVTASASGKLSGFFLFFQKLWLGISGTYYLPPLRPTLVLIGAGLPLGMIAGYQKRDKVLLTLQIHQLAWALGLLLIGRYNATSILFFVPGAVLTWILLAGRYADFKAVYGILIGGILWFAFLSFWETTALPAHHYETYLAEIRKFVPEDAVVLANLNTEFGFEAGNLYDYRNLTHLQDEGESVAGYLRNRGIEYILYADELDYLHRNPEPWQVLYGDDSGWYDEMQAFLAENCEEVANFEAPVYGNRIVAFLNDPYWHLHIYRMIE